VRRNSKGIKNFIVRPELRDYVAHLFELERYGIGMPDEFKDIAGGKS